jgi:putative addiction module component (TIGR02574 family)
MAPTVKSLGIDRLGVHERLALVEEIWDGIAAETSAVPMTEAQREELVRRYDEDEASPDAVTSWEEVKASTLSRFRK